MVVVVIVVVVVVVVVVEVTQEDVVEGCGQTVVVSEVCFAS